MALSLGTLTGYSMMLSYFFWVWATIGESTGFYSDLYFLSMGAIALVYLVNVIVVVPRIRESR